MRYRSITLIVLVLLFNSCAFTTQAALEKRQAQQYSINCARECIKKSDYVATMEHLKSIPPDSPYGAEVQEIKAQADAWAKKYEADLAAHYNSEKSIPIEFEPKIQFCQHNMIITGKTFLPAKTNIQTTIWRETEQGLEKVTESKGEVIYGGTFRIANQLVDEQKIDHNNLAATDKELSAKYRVDVQTHFQSSDQPAEVLKLVGLNGEKITSEHLIKDKDKGNYLHFVQRLDVAVKTTNTNGKCLHTNMTAQLLPMEPLTLTKPGLH